jgi:hypothetical protein
LLKIGKTIFNPGFYPQQLPKVSIPLSERFYEEKHQITLQESPGHVKKAPDKLLNQRI